MRFTPDDHRPVETKHIDLHPQGIGQAGHAIQESGDRQTGALNTQGIVDAVYGVRRKNSVNFRACSPDLFNGVKQDIFIIIHAEYVFLICHRESVC